MASRDLDITVPVEDGAISGTLSLPERAQVLVLFAHGSGSSRFSPRNRYVAGVLHTADIATLLLDLLTPEEERTDALTGHLRFDVELLAGRLGAATDWVASNERLRTMRLGYFGASTGVAAALIAAASRPSSVGAVVSRGGRPDLAGWALDRVIAPTLFIVGERDRGVVRLNKAALARLAAPRKALRLVPNATHLFEEAGALQQVAELALAWFELYLGPRAGLEESRAL